MSSIVPIELDFSRVCQQLVAGVSQARDLRDLLRHCADLLDLIVPGTSFEVMWEANGIYDSLGGRGVLPAIQPEPTHLAQLRAGMMVDVGVDDVSWLPLRLRGELRGWLQLAPAGFSADQASVLSMLSGMLAPTIATLVNEPNNNLRIDQLRILNEIGQALSSVLSIDALPEAIYAGVCRVLDAPVFSIALYEEPQNQLRLLMSIEDGRRLPVNQTWSADTGLASVVVRQRASLRTDRYAQECRKRGIEPLAVAGEVIDNAWMCVPMLLKDQVLGIIIVANLHVDQRYTDEQLELLQSISAQAGVAIANARLYERTERQTRQLDSLNRIGRSITSTLDPERVPSLIMHHLQELLDAEEGSLLLLDRESGELMFAYAGGPTGSRLIGQRLPHGAGIAGYVFTTGQSTIVNNVRTDGRFYADTDTLTGFVTNSMLAAPLLGMDGVLGVMEVINKRNGAPFTAEDRRLIEAVADQAVIALENARRFAQVDQALAQRVRQIDQTNQQLREILRLGNGLRAARTLDGVLRQVADAVSTSTGFRSAVIALVHRQQTRQPYLQRAAVAGIAASTSSLAPKSRAPLNAFEALLRPEFKRGPATYLIDHRYGDYFALWSEEEQRPFFSQWPVQSDGWDPRDVLLTVLVDSAGQLIGFLRVHEPETGHLPTSEQVQVLEIFANQAAVAIENARLYEELQHGLHSLMALNGLGMAINSTRRSQEHIFSLTASGVVEMTDALEAYVLLKQDSQDESSIVIAPEPLVHIGNGQGSLPLVRQRAQNAATTGRPDMLVIDQADTPEAVAFLASGARTLVAIPLRATQQTLGALCVCYRENLPPAADLETLTLFATQAATAAESMRLWDALSRGRDQLASIMASTRDGILLIDTDGCIAVANDALHQLCGTSTYLEQGSLQALLHAWADGSNYPEDEWHLLREGLAQIASGDEDIVHGQLNQLAPRARSLEWAVLPAHSAGESLGGQLLVVRDITAAKEAERLRQDLTNMIVHDMRSPIASVMTSIDMLSKGVSGDLNDTQRNVLTIAYNSAHQMLDMVGLMLDISRLESGRMPLNRMPTPLDSLVRRATGRLSPIARDRQIVIQNDFPDDLPFVYADSDLIARVLQNLLDNALKFSGLGSTIVVRATVVEHPKAAENGNGTAEVADIGGTMLASDMDGLIFMIDAARQVMVSVSDRGVGIAPKDQEKIFDKFGQVGERRGGTGLGLTFCKLVAENHGGTIGVQSALGEGSTFFFTLPIVRL